MKYELTTNKKDGLTQIRALRDIPLYGIKKGDLGGWVRSEKNLSQEGDCWISGNAWISGDAWVLGNAVVTGYAQVSGNAVVTGYAQVSGNAVVTGYAQVSGNARVSHDARVYENAQVSGYAQVSGNARVSGKAVVSDDAWVFGDAKVYGDAKVTKSSECINIINLRHNITITPNWFHVGCKTWKSLKEFEKNYKEVGKEEGYSGEECELVASLIKTHFKIMEISK